MRIALFSLIVVVHSVPLYAGSVEKRLSTDMIVIHHSESESGNTETFRRYHVEVNKWIDIGYHFIITNGRGGDDGQIETGRGVEFKGAHAGKATGRNSHSVGVCLVGRDRFTSAQKAALVNLLVHLCEKYGIDPSTTTIQAHHDRCPGNSFGLREIVTQVQQRVRESTLHARR